MVKSVKFYVDKVFGFIADRREAIINVFDCLAKDAWILFKNIGINSYHLIKNMVLNIIKIFVPEHRDTMSEDEHLRHHQ